MSYFADIILPLPLPRLFTYAIPVEWLEGELVGKRVVVQFGKHRMYSGLVRRIHQTVPEGYEPKYITSVLDTKPIVNETQFLLWEWIASYYMCPYGDVMNAALPSALKLQSETRVVMNPSFEKIVDGLTDNEYLIAEALELQHVLSLSDIGKITGLARTFPLVKSLIDKGVVLVEEALVDKYKPRTMTFVRLAPPLHDETALKKVFERLEKRAPKQLEVLMSFLKLLMKTKAAGGVSKQEILKEVKTPGNAFGELVKKNIFETEEREVGRLDYVPGGVPDSFSLSTAQQKALDKIRTLFEKKEVVLLHGVTSSGKTEIYMKLIEEVLAEGKQVLYLLPEIALTTQIISRLRKFFGEAVGVYHSRFNDQERVEVWSRTQQSGKSYSVILGARSALFMPFKNLGLVIVDEEHETSFKQFDPSPRYHARDTAVFLAHLHGAKTLLGSATPSLESYFNATAGKYGFVTLNERYGGMHLPEIIVADIRESTRKKRMKSHFSPLLLDEIKSALALKEQVILFQNRRGFAPVMECARCGWVPKCAHCDVTLTYHKHINSLRCHYCGYSQQPSSACASCGDTNIRMLGFGTEKIEDDLAVFFPQARIARLDFDATRTKHAYSRIIGDFEVRNIDILVGTQMVTKGLDFDNVSTVGILNADTLLNFPDFRSFERSFQLMAQVSGRSGRKYKRGKVIIQTFTPGHSVIRQVIANDYFAMYSNELEERRRFHYPPFYRLIELTLKHKDRERVSVTAKELVSLLTKKLGRRVLGPEVPVIGRIRNNYLQQVLVKVEKEASVKQAKEVIAEAINTCRCKLENRSVVFSIDVDPS